MNELERFRRQHEELGQRMIEIERASLELPNPLAATQCARLLAKMSGLLHAHLMTESAYFYAHLERFDNPTVRALCRRFQDEIELFRPSFRSFIEKYSVGATIDKDPGRFQSELVRQFDWLRRRMSREERELYLSVERALAKRLAARQPISA